MGSFLSLFVALASSLSPALAADVTVVGSSTVGDVLARVAQAWRAQGAQAIVVITGSGSNAALPALADGSAQLAPVSRSLTEVERAAYRDRRGRAPLELVIGFDALAVFVHRDHPLPAITLAQLDAVFGTDRRRGHPPVLVWGDVGETGEWAQRPVLPLGSTPYGGGYALLREVVLQGGAFAARVQVEPVASSIVQGVGTDLGAIGCTSVGLLTRRTRIVPVGETRETAMLPTAETCRDGRYRLARPLIVCIDPASLSADARAFLTFVLSANGQSVIAASGCFTLGEARATEALHMLAP